MPALPEAFLGRPIAHRALHGPGAPENSGPAIDRAIAAGYGIEIDVQLSSDGRAMVFHDYDLQRLTGTKGAVQQRSAAALADLRLLGTEAAIPTLREVLAQVAGAVPLLIEVKDQDGTLGPRVGPLEDAVAADLESYSGPVAVMSFNPHSVAHFAGAAPQIARGLTTDAFTAEDWPTIPAATRDRLRDFPDYHHVGASFISHAADDLDNPRVTELKNAGAAILCWTIRSAAAEAQARRIAQNVTFEGYDA